MGSSKRKYITNRQPIATRSKRQKTTSFRDTTSELLECLPDDIVISIVAMLSSSANSPSDLASVRMTCKRLNTLALHSVVLSKASTKTFSVKARNWSQSSHRFLKQCADAGNIEACYTLGMIRFYCLENRESGKSLISKAAMKSHAPALYSLAVIQFNGSGGSKDDKDLRAGVALCARAAFLGHVDALRELGHCLQDGYGVRQNIAQGRQFLVQANARELAAVLGNKTANSPTRPSLAWNAVPNANVSARVPFPAGCPLLSDYGCNVPAAEPHVANRFMIEWYGLRAGPMGPNRRLCSHVGCGRAETRKREFRRCSVCGAVNYCSRACQALHWKSSHKAECAPVERFPDDGDGDGGDGEVPVVVADS